jgi:putative nucleotidyltransferase with HDIG domain
VPGLSGIDLLTSLRDISPETVKILKTGKADLTRAFEVKSIKEVFRFIVKPEEEDALLQTIEEGIKHYRLIKAMACGDEDAFLSLARAIELKDPYTKGHAERVADFATKMAERLGLPEDTRRSIRDGGWLHDCGKIGVQEALLKSADKLSDSEIDTIRQHPLWGARIARQARLPETVINIILHHHERYDGEGYPYNLRGRMIPTEARIVTIADIYDALISKRAYRDALPHEEALALMDSMSGSYFDPDLMWLFHAIVVETFDIRYNAA